MKKLIILPLLFLLGGCVSYYQPETALEDGVYYPEDDPAYVFNSSDYSGVIVYPWSSLDYFYMGYGGFYGHRFAYGYPYGWGYSPLGYPYGYYGHHRPRYFSSFYQPYWPYRGYCSPHSYCRHSQWGNGKDVHERYARSGVRDRDAVSDKREDYTPDGDRDDLAETSTVRRHVTTAPAGYDSNRGVVVRNNGNSKVGGSHRLDSSKPSSSKSSSAKISSPSPVLRPSVRTPSRSTSGNRARSSSVSRSTGRQSSGSSKSAPRRDRD